MSKEKEFLNQRTDKFTIVLNDNELELFKNSQNIFTKLVSQEDICVIYVAIIKHDKDYDEETHHLKTKHYHVVLHIDKNCRLGTMLHRLSDLFHCNENQITIDKCNSLCMQSRYLLHMDEIGKAEYFRADVVTNDWDIFNRYFHQVKVGDLHDLIAVVQRFNYDLESIMENVAHYDKWRKYINDLIVNHNRKY